MNNAELLQVAKTVFDREIDALKATRELLDERFNQAVKLMVECGGKIVTTGIGKSGLVARKIAATLSSTGTQSVFVHPVECLHGDMGMISREDVVLLLSKSGESDEIRKLITYLQGRNVKVIGVTERPESFLGVKAAVILPFTVPREACPMGMAPMASTTVQMVIGDALAAALIEVNHFKPDDFAEFHPAGTLGKRLLLHVRDLMHTGNDCPIIETGVLMKEALITMTGKAMGAVIVINSKNELMGIITDGDLRRSIQQYGNILEKNVETLMTANPISVHENDMALDALKLMENRKSQIAVLPVVNHLGKVSGLIRLHDLVIAGL